MYTSARLAYLSDMVNAAKDMDEQTTKNKALSLKSVNKIMLKEESIFVEQENNFRIQVYQV